MIPLAPCGAKNFNFFIRARTFEVIFSLSKNTIYSVYASMSKQECSEVGLSSTKWLLLVNLDEGFPSSFQVKYRKINSSSYSGEVSIKGWQLGLCWFLSGLSTLNLQTYREKKEQTLEKRVYLSSIYTYERVHSAIQLLQSFKCFPLMPTSSFSHSLNSSSSLFSNRNWPSRL